MRTTATRHRRWWRACARRSKRRPKTSRSWCGRARTSRRSCRHCAMRTSRSPRGRARQARPAAGRAGHAVPTHALLQPGDRLAWLAVLRAPWCGLALADLVALCDAAAARPLTAVLAEASVVTALSDDGRQRLARVGPILAAARTAHGRATVAARVRGAWLALGGPACLADALDLDTAERFFDVLAAENARGTCPTGARSARHSTSSLHRRSPPPRSRVPRRASR